jgi:hypothetical protein
VCDIVPAVNNTVLCTSKFVNRVDLILNAITNTHNNGTQQRDTRKLSDGTTCFVYVKTHQIIYMNYIQFLVYKSHVNKAVKK